MHQICGEMLYVCGLSYAEKGSLTPEIQAAVQEVFRLQAAASATQSRVV